PVARPPPDPSATGAGAVAALASLESAVALLAWPPTLRRVPSLAHGLQGDPSPVRFDVLDLDRELVALLDGLLDAVQAPAPAELRDVHQTVGAREDVHERSEVRGLHHGSFVALADLGHPGVDDLLDHLLGLVRAAALLGADEHLSVVLDVDVGSGESNDLVDALPLRPDHLPDLVDGDLDHLDARRLLRERGARLGEGLQHHVQALQP